MINIVMLAVTMSHTIDYGELLQMYRETFLPLAGHRHLMCKRSLSFHLTSVTVFTIFLSLWLAKKVRNWRN